MIALLRSLLLALASGAAQAAEVRVVRAGETVESIAAELGDPGLADALRSLNQIAAGAQPEAGRVIALPDGPGQTADQLAYVIAVTGSGTATGADKVATSRAPAMTLPVGTVVCTDAESYATLRLAREQTGWAHDDVSLLQSTCITIVGASARPGRRSSAVAVTEGAVRVVGSDDTPGDVIVQTPDGTTAGDRGGFRVTLEQGASRTEALTAPVDVMGAGEQVTLAPAEGTRVRAGEAPDKPQPLTSARALFAPEDGAPLRWPDFRWEAVPRALGYRLQLSTRADFSVIVQQVDVPFPEWKPDFLLLPYEVAGYWWRVAPLDRFGFEGTPTEARRLQVPAGVTP